MENDDIDGTILATEWVDVEIEAVLDSGCCGHVMDIENDAPQYVITESASSRRGGGFIVGNGEKVPNEGQAALNLEVDSRAGPPQRFTSTFQAARVTRPLMSVSKICGNGFRCVFDKDKAEIIDADDKPVCVFERRGGLYITRMKVKSPSPFQGPA